jgi:hypothetical protein
MKRRRFLKGLVLASPLLLGGCKKDLLPKTATVISGKVMDDKGKPIENVPLEFSGYRVSGGSIAGGGIKEDTFKIEKSSDKNGVFEFSQVVPEITQDTYFSMGDTFIYSYFEIQMRKNGVKLGTDSGHYGVYLPSTIPTNFLTLGEKNEIELILTKK